MTITFHDRAPLQKVRRLADGRIAATAKFARSGVYKYSGSEVGRPEIETVNIYRPEAEVFDHTAMASFAHKAITVGHPPSAVTADNWKQHSAGWTEGKVARDGDYVEIPLMLADASAVQAYDSGVNQLSAGYTCELVWADGIAPSGEKYSAKQVKIRGDHIAIVAAGRAGNSARIGDSANENSRKPLFDGAAIRDAAKAARNLPRVAHHQSTSDANPSKGNTASIRDAAKAARNR